jgi:hypothetical protein
LEPSDPGRSDTFHGDFTPFLWHRAGFADRQQQLSQRLAPAILGSAHQDCSMMRNTIMTPGVRRKTIRRFTASRITVAPALTVITLLLTASAGSVNVLAQVNAAHAQTWMCPDRYSLIDTQPPYCFSDAGDVTEPTAIYRPATAPGCRQGYGRLGELCISPATGDVELAEMPAGTQASR